MNKYAIFESYVRDTCANLTSSSLKHAILYPNESVDSFFLYKSIRKSHVRRPCRRKMISSGTSTAI